MDRDDELTTAHEQLRLATAAYAEMVSVDEPLQTELEYDEVLPASQRAGSVGALYATPGGIGRPA